MIYYYIIGHEVTSYLKGGVLTAFILLSFSVCSTLTNLYNLRKNETGITWCQISILIAIGVWLLGIISIFNIQINEKNTVGFGVIGGLLAWIFQDKVKGALAFIHLRLHHLLSIDDWIQVPKYNVDGVVNRVSLTTVTVYNWDTTTSTIPISTLHSDHFINFQKMAANKTYGRQMSKTFIVDTSQVHAITSAEAEQLKQLKEITPYLLDEDIHEGILNAQLYRLYLYHWLMNHPKLSQLPRLIVSWQEQTQSGMSLHVMAYVMDGDTSAYEWIQSQIIEHVVESLDWFGLRLYQSPSSYDISKGLTQITGNEAENEKEAKQ